jgi:hypothetical protein
MKNIKKAGSYFMNVTNILILATIINIIFFIVLTQAPPQEAVAADFPETVSSDPIAQANYDFQRQQAIAEKINENIKTRSYAINVLICLNSFLTILLIFHLYKAANCLLEYDKNEKKDDKLIEA